VVRYWCRPTQPALATRATQHGTWPEFQALPWPAAQNALAFVCGPNRFVEAVAQLLVKAGYPSDRVKTERFGEA
jgi:ferredoxin-NADP reductase